MRQSVTHYHPYHEYIYMASGKAHYYVNGGQYELHPGELMLIPPGMVHTGYYDTYDRLILQIDDAFWRETLQILGPLAEGCQIPRELMIFHADVTDRWQIRSLIEHAASAAAIPEAHDKDLMYRSILVGLVLVIRQAIREDGLGQPTSTNALVGVHQAEHPRLPDRAADAGLPPGHRRRQAHPRRLHRERLLGLQQLPENLPQAVRHHPHGVPRQNPGGGVRPAHRT